MLARRIVASILFLAAIVASQSALSEVDSCRRVSKLWAPPASSKETVAKWDDSIGYNIFFDDNIKHDSLTDSFAKLVIRELGDFESASGLKIDYVLKGNIRLVVFISNDIENAKFLNGKFLSYFFGKDSPGVILPNFGAIFAQRKSLIERGCSSMIIRIPGGDEIRGAVLLLQADKSQLCVDEAIAGALGLVNIFDDDNVNDFDRDAIIDATRQLYDKRVSAGEMSAVATKTIEGICQ
jgi:hypothetical protein